MSSVLPQEHTFSFALGGADERVKLWIDDTLVVDQWSSLSSAAPQGVAALCARAAHGITVHYANTIGASQARLMWETNGPHGNIVRRPVPAAALAPRCDDLPGSPFILTVEPSAAATASAVSGRGLTVGTAGVATSA